MDLNRKSRGAIAREVRERHCRGWTQREMSDSTGYTEKTVSNFENDQRITQASLDAMVGALRGRLSYLGNQGKIGADELARAEKLCDLLASMVIPTPKAESAEHPAATRTVSRSSTFTRRKLAWGVSTVILGFGAFALGWRLRTPSMSAIFTDCWGGTVSQADPAGGFTLTRTVRGVDAGCYAYLSGNRERFPLTERDQTRLDLVTRSRTNGAFYAVSLHFWNGNTFVGEVDWLKDEIQGGVRRLDNVEGWANARECINEGKKVRCWPATTLVLQVRIQPQNFDPGDGLPAFTFADVRVRAGR